jgi:hypothetical protein
MNLNEILTNDADGDGKQKDFSTKGENNEIEVYFKNIEKTIINKIKQYKYVVGCVAWLTNKNILKELAKCKSVLIIVQEEDFLRPDTNFNGDKLKWKEKIKKLYSKLEKGPIDSMCWGVNSGRDDSIETGIRRFGLVNEKKIPAFPRMHNKFIFCYNELEYIMNGDEYKFITDGEVITGSYNYTENSNNSLENIIGIKDKKIINGYFKQFVEISTMSMPLNWDGEWKPSKSGIRYGT